MQKVIFIVGPTAIGKTSLAIKLARKINGEIISADSMQIYKGMDIVSQSPSALDKRKIPHHLVGVLSPGSEYSAALFENKAKNAIKKIIKSKKIPIVVGGSGLYIRALLDGLFPSKGKSAAYRKKLGKLVEKYGKAALHKKLKSIDPASASAIHPNDTRRIIRALEIYEIEKRTKTSLTKDTRGIGDIYDISIFGLNIERSLLYEKINKRVDRMYKKGVVREVKRLLREKLSMMARKALGIKEVEGYLNKLYDLAKSKELLKRNTRRFAKRQLTWFRKDARIMWINLSILNEARALDKIIGVLWKEPS